MDRTPNQQTIWNPPRNHRIHSTLSSSTALFFKSNFKVALYKKILVPERSHMNQSMSPCRFTFVGHFWGDMMPPQNLADFWRFDFNSQGTRDKRNPEPPNPIVGWYVYLERLLILLSPFSSIKNPGEASYIFLLNTLKIYSEEWTS